MKTYILAHTWKDTDLTIKTFHSAQKTNKYLGELLEDEWDEKPNPDDSPQLYIAWYNSICGKEENITDYYIKLLVLEGGSTDKATEVTPKNLHEFRKTVTAIPLSESNQYSADDVAVNALTVLRYSGWTEIALMRNGMHDLVIDQSEYEGKLEELEILLWDWIKWELRLTKAEMLEDLQDRMWQFIKDLSTNTKMSLADSQRCLYFDNEMLEIDMQTEDYWNDTIELEYEYLIPTSGMWCSFDHGTVKAASIAEAKKKAIAEVKCSLELVNSTLIKGTSIDMNLFEIEVTLKS